MNNARTCIAKAAKLNKQIEATLAPLNLKLSELLEDDNASVFFQPSDGWCVLFDGDHNAPVGEIDFDVLFQLGKDAALEYLHKRSI